MGVRPARGYPAADPADAVIALLATARRRGPLAGSTTVVAIDGPSGAGKTTLADRLIAAIGDLVAHADGLGPTLIHMDDLYPGWDGLADAVPLLVDRVLLRLAAGAPGTYRRYDWARGVYAEAQRVPVGGWVVVEGVGCGSQAAAPYLSALSWVDAPAALRLRRGLDRDGEAYRPHWERWARQERALFARERTAYRADVLVETGGRTGENGVMTDESPQPSPGVGDTALRDAVVEMTHAQGDGLTTRFEGETVLVTRRTEFLRIAPHPGGGLDLLLRYPDAVPNDARLQTVPDTGVWRRLRVAASDVDADLLALEPLIEAAYAQNG